MSRRAIVFLVSAIAAIVLANIIILAIWLPRRANAPANTSTATAAQPATPLPATAQAPAAAASPAQPSSASAGAFAVQRQVTSASGNLLIKYARDSKSKMRRIIVEDAHRPDASTVIYESKNNAWVLVSPNDEWIALDERTGADGGGARLYHRSGGSGVRYEPVQNPTASGQDLQDAVWKVYLSAGNADSNSSRHGVTIDATGWEKDSQKLSLSVAYLPSADKPDVPEPWACTYDVASKKVEPVADQPVADSDTTGGSTGSPGSNEPAFVNADQMGGDQANAAGDDDEEDAEDALPGERFPATREDELSEADVNESSLDDINYAINEMYARHGAEFKDKQVAKQFSEFPWYEARSGVSNDEIEKEFNDLEKKNLQVLRHCRDIKGAAAQKKPSAIRGQRVREKSTGEQIMEGVLNSLPHN